MRKLLRPFSIVSAKFNSRAGRWAAYRPPKMASARKSLHKYERWRGEIFRETSRKVVESQDGTFTFLQLQLHLRVPLTYVQPV